MTADAQDALVDGPMDAPGPIDSSLDIAYPSDAVDETVPADAAGADGGEDASADVAIVCTAGTGDCDGNASNGCESDTTSDVANCGACSSACPSETNANPLCSGGTCAYTCQPGFEDCNGYHFDGCESNSALDPMNCGGCGTNCGTGGCASGVCLPPPEVLATGIWTPQLMTIDAANVYWTEAPNLIRSCPKEGGPTTTLTDAKSYPSELTTDGVNVYFFAEMAVYKVPVGGGPVTWLAPMDGNHRMASDGTHVYYLDQGDIRRVPVDGGPSDVFVSPGSYCFAIDQGWLLWADTLFNNAIEAKPLEGGTTLLVVHPLFQVVSLAAAGGHVVWGEFDGELGSSLYAVPMAGGFPTILDDEKFGPVTMDATRMYWRSNWGVSSILLNGGSHIVLAGWHKSVTSIEVDDTHVYWLENLKQGRISRTPKP